MRFLWGVVVIATLAGSDALAQSRTTCALAGRVIDETESALPGATVQIESVALIGGPKSVTTDKHGRFLFSDLPSGPYLIGVALAGYKSVAIEGTQLSVGMRTEVPIKLIHYAGEETLHVKAPPVAIDTRSSATSTVLPPDYLENIPTDRDTSHILDQAPGVNLESAYGGAEESGNAYEMDGVDISDSEVGEPWSFFNYSLIDEVELIGLGAPAEYGEFTGIVFNSVTKSGGNDFSGLAELLYSDKNLTGSNSSSADLASTIKSHAETVFQAGGPIRKDKLWYFVSGQYVRDLSSEGGPTQTEKDPRLFGKLTWQASPKNLVQGWLEWDHTKVIGGNGDAFTPIEATVSEDDPDVVWNLGWKSVLSDKSILNVAWGGYSGSHNFDPHSGFSIPGRFDAVTEEASDNPQFFEKLERVRNQVNVSLSHHASDFAGDHEFKYGAEVEHSRVHDRSGHPGDAFYYDNAGPAVDPSTGNPDYYSLGEFGGASDVQATNERVSFFAQDSWKITPRFTLNPGLRLDVNRGRVSSGTVYSTEGLAPRIGFAWDLRGDARSVLKAHYGRYFEALYTSYYKDLDSGAFSPSNTKRFFNTSGFVQDLGTIQGQKFAMSPNIKQPYLDQFTLGYERELGRGIVVGGTLVYRKNSNLIETVSRDGQFVPVRGEIPGTGQHVTLFDYLNPTTDVLLYTNPPELKRTYRAAILTLTRRMSENWQLEASYVYSEARGNIDNSSPTDPTGGGTNVPVFDDHFLDTPNSLVNAQGRLTHDQTNQVKLQGTRIFPSLHLSVSADYVFHSGDTWTPRDTCLLTDDGNGVIGDGILGCHTFPQGQVLYFAEPRGSRRMPSRSEIDLRARWYHDLAKDRRLRVDLDVFNLANQSRATEVETLAGSELGNPATINFPRSFRLGVGYSW